MKQVHVITGGSSGIGLECAKRFKEGIVLITGRRENKLIEACAILKEEGIQADYLACDISKREDVKALMQKADSLGALKTVLNSAGVSGIGVSAEETFNIDLVGSANLVEEGCHHANPGTVMILIASMMGHVVPPNPAYDGYLAEPLQEGAFDKLNAFIQDKSDIAYNFTKRGVHLLVKKNAERFGQKGARILSISPGIIMTPMAVKAAEEHPEQMNYMKMMTPAGRNGEPKDIADVVEFLASDKASFLTGTDILVDGGLTLNLGKIAAAMAQKESGK